MCLTVLARMPKNSFFQLWALMNCIALVFVILSIYPTFYNLSPGFQGYIEEIQGPTHVILFHKCIMLANDIWLAKTPTLVIRHLSATSVSTVHGSVGDRIRIGSDPHHFAESESAFRHADPDTADPDLASKQCRSTTVGFWSKLNIAHSGHFRHNLYRNLSGVKSTWQQKWALDFPL